MQVIKASQKGDLKAIDEIDLWKLYKWKIAFHYQNPNNMKIVCIFSYDILCKIAKGEKLGLKDKPKISEIYQALLKDKTYTLETMINEKWRPLWEKYNGNSQENTTPSKIPLNQILYGPPGTGKTYSTINKALEILALDEFGDTQRDEIRQILAKLHANSSDKVARKEALAIFNERKKDGQIAFITFHQNFSYEEFIEGIKPDIENSGKSDVIYIVKDGIFKKMCERALRKNYIAQNSPENHPNLDISDSTRVWKISLGEKGRGEDKPLKEYCYENGEIRIGTWGGGTYDSDNSSVVNFEQMQIGHRLRFKKCERNRSCGRYHG